MHDRPRRVTTTGHYGMGNFGDDLCGVPFAAVGHHEKLVDFAADIGLDPARVLPMADPWNTTRAELTRPGWHMDPADYVSRAERVYGGAA